MRHSNIIEGRVENQSGLTLIECRKLSKKLKNGLKTKHPTNSKLNFVAGLGHPDLEPFNYKMANIDHQHYLQHLCSHMCTCTPVARTDMLTAS